MCLVNLLAANPYSSYISLASYFIPSHCRNLFHNLTIGFILVFFASFVFNCSGDVAFDLLTSTVFAGFASFALSDEYVVVSVDSLVRSNVKGFEVVWASDIGDAFFAFAVDVTDVADDVVGGDEVTG